MSLVLRHRPDAVGITLDEGGWVPVSVLVAALARRDPRITRSVVEHVVATNDKQRFALDRGRDQIRAHQGHSVPVDLGLPTAAPPPVLFHGTAAGHVDAIVRDGLRRGRRHDVHLSADVATAGRVGARRGPAVIFRVDAVAMARDGHLFRVTPNGVWLTGRVPPAYLQVVGERHRGRSA
jgi:putative RNA 2'-phosphotransferase